MRRGAIHARVQAAILAMLAVLAVAVYARLWHPSPAQATQPAVASSTEQSVGAVESGRPAVRSRKTVSDAQRTRAAELSWGRDPFMHGDAAGHVLGLALSGILWDLQSPMAIINGQMVRVGQTYEGVRIVAIEPDAVTVSDGAQTHRLALSP